MRINIYLQKLGLDFMILEDEGCCGTYLYESGRTDLATDFFQKNVDRFKSLGIREIVVPCNGCLKCFKYFYPDLLGKTDFYVRHVVEVIYELLKENTEILGKAEKMVTYQDSCRLGRGEAITEAPRKVLEWCGIDLREAVSNRGDAVCCTDIAQRPDSERCRPAGVDRERAANDGRRSDDVSERERAVVDRRRA